MRDGPERDDREQRGDDHRHGEERVDHSHGRLVGEAAVVTGGEPDRDTHDGAEQRRERCHDQDLARPDDHAGEDIPAEAVGAEEVVAGGRCELGQDVVGLRVLRRDQRPEDRAHDPEAEEREPDNERR